MHANAKNFFDAILSFILWSFSLLLQLSFGVNSPINYWTCVSSTTDPWWHITCKGKTKGLCLTALLTKPPAPYSAIHKAAVRPAAVQNDLRRSFLPAAPIDSQWTLFCSTGIVPGKARNGSASSFVNRAVSYQHTGGRNDPQRPFPHWRLHGWNGEMVE